ncbi:hypothetical protein YC2023_062985 [Brassica napus]
MLAQTLSYTTKMDIPKRYLLLFILIIFVTTDLSHAEIQVEIVNNLGSKMQFHCKSKDIDLRDQRLQPGGSWSFQFQRNFFGRSLFYCSFDLPNGRRWFDIYEEPRDFIIGFSIHYLWRIGPYGLCKYTLYSNRERWNGGCFYWNKK